MAYLGFSKLASILASKGVGNPNAAAAAIGRKKYGRGRFQRAASSGTKMKGMAPA